MKRTVQHENCVKMVLYSQKRSRQDCVGYITYIYPLIVHVTFFLLKSPSNPLQYTSLIYKLKASALKSSDDINENKNLPYSVFGY